MEITTILEEGIRKDHKKNWYIFLLIQKLLVEEHFDWLKVVINHQSKALIGKGTLGVGFRKYNILFSYSPFHDHRYDRIYIDDRKIEYHHEIHIYGDCSLCLYHPTIDRPLFQTIPLFRMVPWIGEWIVFYEQWKIYGVWFGKEIKH